MSVSEGLILSGNVGFVGVTVVFLVLSFLVMVVSIFGLIAKITSGKDKQNPTNQISDEDYESGSDSEESDNSVSESTTSNITHSGDENNESIIAAIMAAISIVMGSISGFKIRSIRRTGRNTPSWNRAGRNEYHSSRL